jgi:hypothetical protein
LGVFFGFFCWRVGGLAVTDTNTVTVGTLVTVFIHSVWMRVGRLAMHVKMRE